MLCRRTAEVQAPCFDADLGLELTRFRGHPTVNVEGVRNAITKPPYPAAFRQQIIELVSSGRSPAELAREFGCTAQTIANWVAQSAIDRGKP